jgi:hypothetical protein
MGGGGRAVDRVPDSIIRSMGELKQRGRLFQSILLSQILLFLKGYKVCSAIFKLSQFGIIARLILYRRRSASKQTITIMVKTVQCDPESVIPDPGSGTFKSLRILVRPKLSQGKKEDKFIRKTSHDRCAPRNSKIFLSKCSMNFINDENDHPKKTSVVDPYPVDQ